MAAKDPNRQIVFDKYVRKAIEGDTSIKGKTDIAKKAMDIFKKAGNQPKTAEWALNVMSMTPNPGKLDIFNAGIESLKADNYERADSVFDIYKSKYPDEVFGHYWSFRSLSAIDSTMEKGLAIPDATNFIAIAENDKLTNKSMLIVAYGYLAGYHANVKKNFGVAIGYLDKIIEIDPGNPDAQKNKEILQKALVKGGKS